LLAFDSVHGRWPLHARADDEASVLLGNKRISYSQLSNLTDVD